MKRFDRTMYALFLLVVLADVARSYASTASMPAGNDAATGMILNAAVQLQANSASGVAAGIRRQERAAAILDRSGKARFSLFAWPALPHWEQARIVALTVSDALSGIDVRSIAIMQYRLPHPHSPAFDHSGSPAP